MAASGDGNVVHAHNGWRVSPTCGSQGIPQRVGRGTTTKTSNIGKGSRLRSRGGNVPVQDRGLCCCRRRCREQRWDRSPPQMLQYREDHRNPIPCHLQCSNWMRTQTDSRWTIQTHSLLQRTERDVISNKIFHSGGMAPSEWTLSIRGSRDTPVADYSVPGINTMRHVI